MDNNNQNMQQNTPKKITFEFPSEEIEEIYNTAMVKKNNESFEDFVNSFLVTKLNLLF